MLRQKKLAQQPVYLQQPVAVQQQVLRVHPQKALFLEMVERGRKPLAHVYTELPLEVLTVDVPELHLKNELPNHALFLGRRKRAIDREDPLVDAVDVGVPVVFVLKMSAVDVRERSHAQADHVGAGPQKVAVKESRAGGIFHRRVRTGDGVAGLLHLGKRVVHPAALGRPVGHRGHTLSKHAHFLRDGGVEGYFHLVDRDTVRRKRNGLADTLPPVLFGLADHARNEVDIDLRKPDGARELVRYVDLLRAVGAPVSLQDLLVEVLNSQAEAGDAHLLEDLQLPLGDGSGFALESDFLRLIPGQQPLHGVHQVAELASRDVGRRAAAEIDEAGFSPADESLPGIKRQFTNHGIQVAVDLGGVLSGIHLEVAEVAALAAEGNMHVDSERSTRTRKATEGLMRLRYQVLVPERIRRVVGDEVIARCGFFQAFVWPLAHREPLFAFPSRLFIEYISSGDGNAVRGNAVRDTRGSRYQMIYSASAQSPIDDVPARVHCRRAELALVSRTGRVRRRRRPKTPGRLGCVQGKQHRVENPDSGPGAFEPDRVGRPHLRDHRGEQQTGRRLQARPVWRGRRLRRP